MSEAPFYIGQKVVCIDIGSTIPVPTKAASVLKKGKVYMVLGIKKSCCSWLIDIGVLQPNGMEQRCSACFRTIPKVDDIWWFRTNRFAPIIENEDYEDITKEIAACSKPTDEVPDIKKVLEPQIN